MKFKFWKGQTVQPFVSLWTLVISIIILGGLAGEYKLPLVIFLGFQLLYILKKGAFLAGKQLHVKARNILTVIIPIMILAQELKFHTFDVNVWMIVLSVFGILIGMAIMGGSEKR